MSLQRCERYTEKKTSKGRVRLERCVNPGKWDCKLHGAFCGVHSAPSYFSIGKARRFCPYCHADITDNRIAPAIIKE